MKLERLTEYDKQGIVHYVRCNEFPNKGCYGECGSCGVQIKGKQRLAELEDKIENGTLVELPCKVGDKLYLVYSPFGDVEEWEITDIQIGNVKLFRLWRTDFLTMLYLLTHKHNIFLHLFRSFLISAIFWQLSVKVFHIFCQIYF